MARELIRRIQDMRKDMDLDVEANIGVMVNTNAEFKELVEKQSDLISEEVRAKSLVIFDGEACEVCTLKGTEENVKVQRKMLMTIFPLNIQKNGLLKITK